MARWALSLRAFKEAVEITSKGAMSALRFPTCLTQAQRLPSDTFRFGQHLIVLAASRLTRELVASGLNVPVASAVPRHFVDSSAHGGANVVIRPGHVIATLQRDPLEIR